MDGGPSGGLEAVGVPLERLRRVAVSTLTLDAISALSCPAPMVGMLSMKPASTIDVASPGATVAADVGGRPEPCPCPRAC